jgi:hypothetical protein
MSWIVFPFWMPERNSLETNPKPGHSNMHQLFAACVVLTSQRRPQLY